MNKLEEHVVRYQNIYLFLILVLVLTLPLISRAWNSQPLIIGQESYYHLSQAQDYSWREFYYYPLHILESLHSEPLLLGIQFLLALLCLGLGLSLLKRGQFNTPTTPILVLFLILSPAFIFTFLSISAYSIYFFFYLLGFWLITQDQQKVRYLSLIPFALTTLTDFGSSLFTLLSLGTYYWYTKSQSIEHRKMVQVTLITTAGVTLLGLFLFNAPLSLGPFYPGNSVSELISDLGSLSGVPFFVFLLGLFGAGSVWKDRNILWMYSFLPLTILLYILNSHYIFLLSLTLIFFAAQGYQKIFSNFWSLETLRKFTLMLVLLGLLFSIISFTNRLSEVGPSADDREALTWIKENIPEETQNKGIFSLPEESYYIKYFTQIQPFYEYHLYSNFQDRVNITNRILASSYISTTFPLLEDNSLTMIYISSKMRQRYSEEEGLLYVLKNERFKMVHSNDNNQVWMFN
ncbi:MAG: hypothetical protein WCV90_03805 [Candidatus Woesearchaeota archaeon]|jgi:hypothetical protein